MAITVKDVIVVGAVVIALVLLGVLVAVLVHNEDEGSPAAEPLAIASQAEEVRRPAVRFDSLGSFGVNSKVGATSVNVASSGNPSGSSGCPHGKASTWNDVQCRSPSNRAAVSLRNSKCPSVVSTPHMNCQRNPDTWSFKSKFLGKSSYVLSGATDCVSPTGDVRFTQTVVQHSANTVVLEGGQAVLHLINPGDYDAKLVSVIAQLIIVKDCSDCSDDNDNQNDDDNRDGDSCDDNRKGRVVASTAAESPAVRHCPHGGGSPATICITHGRKHQDCLVDIPYNESAHLYDLATSAPLDLSRYVVAKKNKCGHETILRLGYEFTLTSAQYQSIKTSKAIVKFLVTYDTSCGTGNVCGFDYDCDGIKEPIRTVSIETPCFSLSAGACDTQCTQADMVATLTGTIPAIGDPSHNRIGTNTVHFSSSMNNNTPLVLGFQQAPVSDPIHFVAYPYLCCDQIRNFANVSTSSDVIMSITARNELVLEDCSSQTNPIQSVFTIECLPLSVPVDCQVAEWNEWSACRIATCGSNQPCDCTQGVHNRNRLIVQQPSNGGQECPTTADQAPCQASWSEWSPCVCPGPTQNRTQSQLPNTNNYMCSSAPVQTQSCNSTVCDLACTVNEWSSWSSCTATPLSTSMCAQVTPTSCTTSCYEGVRTRTRGITQLPLDHNVNCPSTVDSMACKNEMTYTPCISNICVAAQTCVTNPCPSGAACRVDQSLVPTSCNLPVFVC